MTLILTTAGAAAWLPLCLGWNVAGTVYRRIAAAAGRRADHRSVAP